MVGTQQLVLDWRTFLKGMSSSSEIDDGGFSPESDGFNLTAKPGALYAPAALVDSDTDTRLATDEELIASAPDMVVFSGSERLLVSDAGKGYRYTGTKLSAAGIALTAGVTYAKFFTDMASFAGEMYVTGKEKATRWQSDNTIDAGGSWPFSFTNTTYPHPVLVFENNLFFGDGNLLLRMTTVGDAVAPTTIMTLSADQVIVALGIDQATGRMLISTTNSLAVSQTLSQVSKILWYDGFSNKPIKAIVVEEPVFGFHSHSGETFVGYKDKIGRINGSGIEFMRQLLDVYLDSDYLPSKHNFASIGNTLYVVDGKKILAYGEVVKGAGKIWYYCGKNKVNSNRLKMICPVGLGKLGLSFNANKFYTLAVSAITASVVDSAPSSVDAFTLYTNNIDFPRPIIPQSLRLEFVDSFSYTVSSLTITYTDNNNGGGSLIRRNLNVSGFTLDDIVGFATGEKITRIKLFISHSSARGLRRIVLFYDYAE